MPTASIALLFTLLASFLVAMSASGQRCRQHNKIIIDVSSCGLGNKLLSIVSASLLAITMDRVLFVKWEAGKSCNATYDDLFIVDDKSAHKDVFYPTLNLNFGSQIISSNETLCHISITQHYEFSHWWFLRDKRLFEKLQATCSTINIVANQFFAPYVSIWNREVHHPAIHRLFDDKEDAFSVISKCLFRAHTRLTDAAKDEIGWLSSQPSLTIHARGYYDHGKGSSMVIKCANSLLQQGIINRVFFSTDSEHLTSLASSGIVPSSALMMTNKTLTDTKNLDGYSRDSVHRNEMDSALKDWDLIGRGQYCTSPTVDGSTFSQTALSHGTCKYLPYSWMGKDHKFNNDTCLSAIQNMKLKPFKKPIWRQPEETLGLTIDDKRRGEIWDSVKKEVIMMDFPCFTTRTSFKHVDLIRRYWATRETCLSNHEIANEQDSNSNSSRVAPSV